MSCSSCGGLMHLSDRFCGHCGRPVASSHAKPEQDLPRLSKSRFTAGLQCHKLLWWKVHEPTAPELVPDAALRRTFANGHRVGDRARSTIPGGVLIDLPPSAAEQRVRATREAMEARVPAIYEATFIERGVFVAVDILERRDARWRLIEVKSGTDATDAYVSDAALQAWVLQAAGVALDGVDLMVIDTHRVAPVTAPFRRIDVTAQSRERERQTEIGVNAQRRMLAGGLPVVSTGDHCSKPYPCPFWNRCHTPLPAHHVSELYMVGPDKRRAIAQLGWQLITEVPDDYPLPTIAARQRRAVIAGRIVIEPGLREALSAIRGPVAYFDFETVNPALPIWHGTRPYQQVPVQFSVQRIDAAGAVHEMAWLTDGPEDPRAALAEALLLACDGAATLVAWNASFEISRLEELAAALPKHAARLIELRSRVVDLLPIVRDHVYHPDFRGSFSLKAVAPALLGRSDYAGLEIAGGAAASGALEDLIEGRVEASDRESERRQLQRYCATDTRLLVELHRELVLICNR